MESKKKLAINTGTMLNSEIVEKSEPHANVETAANRFAVSYIADYFCIDTFFYFRLILFLIQVSIIPAETSKIRNDLAQKHSLADPT